MHAVAHEIEKGLMNASVVAQFRMESRSHNLALTDSHGIAALSGHNLNSRAEALESGGTDEDHFHRGFAQPTFPDGAVHLPPISIAPYSDIERT